MYPGSFDPIHNGHVDVIGAAASIFSEVIVVAMFNRAKPDGFFSLEDREAMIVESFAGISNVSVARHDGLAIQAAAELQVDVIVKGLRSGSDFDSEMQMAQTNRSVSGIETVFVPTRPETFFVSSRYIREISARGESVDHLIPLPVQQRLDSR